jgi:LemA protein
MIQRGWLLILTLVGAFALTGCGYNDFQRLDEEVKAGWSEVLNQYQRRADLIPNIVATVKGEADFEQQTLTRVVEARARATSIQATPELVNDPAALERFMQAQSQLGSALGRLLAVSEQYPNLKANQGFQDLRVQLEGTENRIAVARRDFIQAVQTYNTEVRTFPGRLWAWIYGAEPKATFETAAANQTAPEVKF